MTTIRQFHEGYEGTAQRSVDSPLIKFSDREPEDIQRAFSSAAGTLLNKQFVKNIGFSKQATSQM